MAAVPSIGRAVGAEGAVAPEADLTRALYERYANQIFRYCLHQLGDRQEADDAVQSTFLNAFRGIKRGVVPEIESAWLFKIAHNVCLSRRRTSWRRARIESPTDFDLVDELTPAPSRRADELIGLQDVLERMPERQRRAILLREWQGLSYREIGEELELSPAAVETLIFRARRALATGLEQPPEPKRRIVRGADLGNILAGLKSLLLGGGAAAKVAATVAVVSASTVVAAVPVERHYARAHAAPAPAVRTSALTAPAASTTPVERVAAAVAGRAAPRPGNGRPRHGVATAPELKIDVASAPAAVEASAEPVVTPVVTPVATEPEPAPAVPEPPAPTPVVPAAVAPTEGGSGDLQHAVPVTAGPGDKATTQQTEKTEKTTSDTRKRETSSNDTEPQKGGPAGGSTETPPLPTSPTVASPAQAVQTTTAEPPTGNTGEPLTGSEQRPGSEQTKGDSDTKKSSPVTPAGAPPAAQWGRTSVGQGW